MKRKAYHLRLEGFYLSGYTVWVENKQVLNSHSFKGELHPNQNGSYFVRYLKIVNTVLKNDLRIL